MFKPEAMADAEEKAKAERLASAKKRVRVLGVAALQTRQSLLRDEEADSL